MYPARCTEESMSEQDNSHYVRTHTYLSGSNKTEVKMHMPLIYDTDTFSLPEVIRVTSHDFQEGEFVCPGFFQMARAEDFVHRVRLSDWNYEWRRQAQAILPFLYLGPLSSLKDKDWLAREGFTLLLAIRSKQSAQARLVSGEKVGTEMGIEADSIDVMDNQELISAFPRAIRRINDHLVSPGAAGGFGTSARKKVLVFCESGNERSATVVIAYLMVMFNLDLATATHVAQYRRFSICMDDPLKQLLVSFQAILEAKRDVQRARREISNSSLAAPQMMVSRKRGMADRLDHEAQAIAELKKELEKDMDMDVDMDMGTNDGNSVGDRMPLAPFQDRKI